MLNVKAISDLHGYLPDMGKVSLLLIAGDVCPVFDHSKVFQDAWFRRYFIDWINGMDFNDEYSVVVMVPGNHDFIFENVDRGYILELENMTNGRLRILINEKYVYQYPEDKHYKKLKIFGTPYCKKFGNWAFMREYSGLKKYYDEIPEGLDILISHDAPDINNLGMIREGAYAGENAGNTLLAEKVKEVRPKYLFCGHIHSGNHNLEEVDGTLMANVSYVNERYLPNGEYMSIDI